MPSTATRGAGPCPSPCCSMIAPRRRLKDGSNGCRDQRDVRSRGDHRPSTAAPYARRPLRVRGPVMATPWMNPLARAERLLTVRLLALERTLPENPADAVGWAEYLRTLEILIR